MGAIIAAEAEAQGILALAIPAEEKRARLNALRVIAQREYMGDPRIDGVYRAALAKAVSPLAASLFTGVAVLALIGTIYFAVRK